MKKNEFPNIPNFIFGQGSSSVVRPLPNPKAEPIPENLTFSELKELLQKRNSKGPK